MECKMEKKIKTAASMCDDTARLGIPAVFALFMDLASEHGSMIGLGADDLDKKGLFWLTVRTKVRIRERPLMMEDMTAVTWPEAPGRIGCNRYYILYRGDKLLIEGKTEWAMIDKQAGRLRRLAEAYPEGIEHCPDVVCPEPFVRMAEDFSGCGVLGKYTVRSTDIDLGRHMNNAAYLRVIFGAFSCEELHELGINDVEVAFRAPCFEGEDLTLLRREAEGALEIGVMRPDGKAAAIARLLGTGI